MTFVAVQTNKCCCSCCHRSVNLVYWSVKTNASACKIDPGLGSHPNGLVNRWHCLVRITMTTKTNAVLHVCIASDGVIIIWVVIARRRVPRYTWSTIIHQHLWFAFNVNSADDAVWLWLKKERNSKWGGRQVQLLFLVLFIRHLEKRKKNTHTDTTPSLFSICYSLSFSASLLPSFSSLSFAPHFSCPLCPWKVEISLLVASTNLEGRSVLALLERFTWVSTMDSCFHFCLYLTRWRPMPHSSAFFVYLTMETILEIFIISGHNGQCVYVCMLSFSLLQLRLRLVGLLICVVEGFLGGGRERDEGDIVCVWQLWYHVHHGS